jgi:hypothetical protein
MVGAAGIDESRDRAVAREGVGDGGRRLALAAHAQAQRLEAFQQHPGIERRERRPGLAQEGVDVVADEGLGPEDDAPETPALAVDVLRRRVDDAVGAELQGFLPQRRREHVVDDEPGAAAARHRRDSGDVDDVEAGIGRALEEQHLGARRDGLFPGPEVASVDEGRGDAEAGKQVLDHVAAGAEQLACGDDVVACPQLAHERGRDRRHPARRCARRLGALERRHAGLEHGDRRVREARVDEAGVLALEASLAILGRGVDVALREEQRLRGLAEGRAQRARVDEQRVEIAVEGQRGHRPSIREGPDMKNPA